MVDGKKLRPDFDDLAFENLQGLLNQRVVLESIFVERNGGGFFLGGRGCNGFCNWQNGLRRCNRSDRRGHGRFHFFSNGRFGLDEFDLAVRVAEFGELRLQQSVIACVVHEAEVIFKFRVEADDQNIFYERNRIRVHEITAREWADAANGFDELRPQSC